MVDVLALTTVVPLLLAAFVVGSMYCCVTRPATAGHAAQQTSVKNAFLTCQVSSRPAVQLSHTLQQLALSLQLPAAQHAGQSTLH